MCSVMLISCGCRNPSFASRGGFYCSLDRAGNCGCEMGREEGLYRPVLCIESSWVSCRHLPAEIKEPSGYLHISKVEAAQVPVFYLWFVSIKAVTHLICQSFSVSAPSLTRLNTVHDKW